MKVSGSEGYRRDVNSKININSQSKMLQKMFNRSKLLIFVIKTRAILSNTSQQNE